MLQVPFAFKYAIDALTVDPTGMTAANMPLVTLMPATLLLGYGAARAGSALFNELRNAVFAKASLHTRHCCISLPQFVLKHFVQGVPPRDACAQITMHGA